jgi:hypothetical protein
MMVVACAPGVDGCLGFFDFLTQPSVEDLPDRATSLSAQTRDQAGSSALSDYSGDLISSLLEGTGVAPGAAVVGNPEELEGTYDGETIEPRTNTRQQSEVAFDETGAATELRLFGEELIAVASLVFQGASSAKVSVQGLLLGTLVEEQSGGRFLITLVAVLDTQDQDTQAAVRTRDVFQFVALLASDGNTLAGAARRTSEVIASDDPGAVPGTVFEAADAVELNRNQPPRANAGVDQSVSLSADEQLTLDGSESSDPEGLPLTFQWSQISGTDLRLFDEGVSSRDPMGSGAFLNSQVPGTAVVELTVTDSAGQTATDSVNITVNP